MTTYDQAGEAMRRLRGLPYNEPPADEAAILLRLKAITAHYDKQNNIDLRQYLCGLGFVRKQVIAARDILKSSGKKKYEFFIESSKTKLVGEYSDLKEESINTLVDLMNIPFKRSAVKDDYEIRLTLHLLTDFIINYRNESGSRMREYAKTIALDAGNDDIPPVLTGMIIQEITKIIDDAVSSGVFAYVETGMTCAEHEEFDSRRDKPAKMNYTSPPLHWPIEGIAQQSLWWGLNDEIDSFLISLSGGLLYGKNTSITLPDWN